MTVGICETRSQKKAPEDISSDRPIRARFQKTRNRIVQPDHSGRTNKSDGPIRALPANHLLYPTNQSSSYGPYFRLDQSDPSGGSSYGPSFRLDQSDPSDGPSYGPSFRIGQYLSVSSNQILRTDLPTDHLPVSANKILRTDLPTYHLPYWPIKSFGVSSAEIPKRSSHSNGHGPHE